MWGKKSWNDLTGKRNHHPSSIIKSTKGQGWMSPVGIYREHLWLRKIGRDHLLFPRLSICLFDIHFPEGQLYELYLLLFLYSWCSGIYGLTDWGVTHSQGYPVLETAKTSSGHIPFLCRLTSQSKAHTPNHLFQQTLTH